MKFFSYCAAIKSSSSVAFCFVGGVKSLPPSQTHLAVIQTANVDVTRPVVKCGSTAARRCFNARFVWEF